MSKQEHTEGPWKALPLGGNSTVLANVQPKRNDTRIPSYGREGTRHCIGYPFLHEDGEARRDFICFSHGDAHLISAAPDMLGALEAVFAVVDMDRASQYDAMQKVEDAIAKARGGAS